MQVSQVVAYIFPTKYFWLESNNNKFNNVVIIFVSTIMLGTEDIASDLWANHLISCERSGGISLPLFVKLDNKYFARHN